MLDLLGRELLALEVLVRQVIVNLGNGLDHVVAVLFGLRLQVIGDFALDDYHRCRCRR